MARRKRNAAVCTTAPASRMEGFAVRAERASSFPTAQSGEPNTAFCHLNTSYVNLRISRKDGGSGKDLRVCYTKVKKKERDH